LYAIACNAGCAVLLMPEHLLQFLHVKHSPPMAADTGIICLNSGAPISKAAARISKKAMHERTLFYRSICELENKEIL